MKDISELMKNIYFHIGENELREILVHASYQPQTEELRKRNKELIVYGTALAKCIHGIYAYLNRKCSDEGTLSTLIAASHSNLIETIYEKYNLKDYELVCLGEVSKVHYDTASKLLALVCKKEGIVSTYYWLEDIMSKTCVNNNYDYKTILQDYVQRNRMLMSYTIIGVDGPDNEKVFTCELSVGKEKVIAKGRSKKEAQKAAAKEYIVQHRIPTERKYKNQRKFIEDQAPISIERQRQLLTIERQLQIEKEDISIEYMNAAFVHKSTQNDVRIKRTMADNSMLTVIGAELTILYTYDYLMNLEFYRFIDVRKEARAYLNSDALRDALPNSWLNAFLSMGDVKEDNMAGYGNVKKEIYHSILAALVLYAIKTQRRESEQKAQKLANALIKTIQGYRKAYCTDVLQEVAEIVKFDVKKDERQKSGTLAHKPIFVSYITCLNKEINFTVKAEGGSKKNATNNASKQALLRIFQLYADNLLVQKVIYKELEPEKYYLLREKEEKDAQEDKSNEDIISPDSLAEVLNETKSDEFDDIELAFLKNLCI